jgi:hypothetical protein
MDGVDVRSADHVLAALSATWATIYLFLTRRLRATFPVLASSGCI